MNERKRFIRLPEVLNRTGLCKAWIYRLISRNDPTHVIWTQA